MGARNSSLKDSVKENTDTLSRLQTDHARINTEIEELRMRKVGMPPSKAKQIDTNSKRSSDNEKRIEANTKALRELAKNQSEIRSSLSRSTEERRKEAKEVRSLISYVFERRRDDASCTSCGVGKQSVFRGTCSV